jgi:tetratricopeptide (TPR) repeat protein
MSSHLFCFAISILLLNSCIAVDAQIRPQQHTRLRAAMDRNDYAGAEQILREMMSGSPRAFARNNYDYLLARLLKRRRANAEAMATFQQVVSRNSPLAGYALLHQAEIARASRNPDQEQRLLQSFISQFNDHLLRERAVQRLGESYLKTGQYEAAINTLRSLNLPRREALAAIGEAQLALRQIDSARLSFEAVVSTGSMDDASLRAVKGLDRIEQAPVTAQTPDERLRRARVYQFNRHFAEARKHWLVIIQELPRQDLPRSERRAEALFQLGRGYFLENNFLEAIRWYNQVHDEFPQSQEGEEGFYFAGHGYQNLGEVDRAIARYEEFLKAYPNSDYFGYAHLNAIDTLRSVGRLEEALSWAARAQALTREPFIVTAAIFNQAKIHLTQQNYQAAVADLTLLKSKNPGARGLTAMTSAAEVTYLRGYSLERLGRFEEAINDYLSLGEVRNGAAGYYGRRATQRLRALANNLRARNTIISRRDQFLSGARAANAQGNAAAAKTAANQALRFTLDHATSHQMLRVLRDAYAKLRGYQLPAFALSRIERSEALDEGVAPAAGRGHQTIAGELLFLGLYDEGAPELAETPVGTQTLAFYCSRGDCAHRTIKYSEPILNSLPEDYRLELLPREWAEVFYPMPHRESLIRHAVSRGIDPRFVLSIIRQESRYDPRVKSQSAARGMMQFITLTATETAAQLGISDFEQSDLYDADTAILFGSQYLQNLFNEFTTPQAVAAAYNGSEDSVRRWRARARSSEADRLVIEVLKRETKDYLFKVMNYYAAYQTIYPNELVVEK